MTLHNFLAPNGLAPVLSADIVFHIAEGRPPHGWQAAEFAHAGLVAADCPSYCIDCACIPVSVYHMAEYIRKDNWRLGSRTCVHLCGTMRAEGETLDDALRHAIVDTAVTFYQLPPSTLKLNLYWMGDPNPHRHPLHPYLSPAYAFTCASFVHNCYEANQVGAIVDCSSMPPINPDQRRALQLWFTTRGIGEHVQQGFFRRLYPSYLMAAFEQDAYPFKPAQWEQWQDHSIYIPAPPLATTQSSGS